MKPVLPDYSKAGVLIVGDVMLDRYWYGPTGRISPEAPVPVVKVEQSEERPGGAANVAMNIASLGGHAHIIGLTGKMSRRMCLPTSSPHSKSIVILWRCRITRPSLNCVY